jgi:Ca2+-binding RTX toxin-like protein
MEGGDGGDVLFGGDGTDTMVGGAGDDFYIVSDLSDTFIEAGGSGSGIDTVSSYLSYMLGSNLENLELLLSAANGNGNDLDNIIKEGQGDSFGGVNNSFSGGAGNDTLQGKAGKDTLTGDAGSDVIDGGPDADLLWGGSQSDDFVTRPGSSPAATELLNDSIQGVSDSDELTFANGVDVVGPGDFLLPEDCINYETQGATKLVTLLSVTNASGLTSLDPSTAYQIKGEWRPDPEFKFTVNDKGSDILFFVTGSVGGAWATGAVDLIGTQSLILDDVRYA